MVNNVNFEKVEIYGFKSFADKSEIKFGKGITGIVGPNGCGKSNVADAIRWVLGEQSAKSLRGSSMQDVIFSGTQGRKSLSYCEVSLFFDNSNRMFNIDYNELIITRKLFRSGESEYYINKQPARLRDIVDLLHECGIGKDGYNIIGQGKVEEIMSAKPEDRRNIFEEALAQAHKGRMEILDNMMSAISEVRPDVSKYAPKLDKFDINPDRIREVIGQGGKTINEIIATCDNVKIDISDEGRVVIYHQDREAINKAKAIILDITKEAKVGEIFTAKVARIESYGAFVNLFKGCDALLHVSQIKHERVNHPKDVLKINDEIRVIVTEIDEKGRVNVSAKDLLPKPEKVEKPAKAEKKD